MGCRTANGWDINGFGQTKDGRGNICPVTIIMPTLAMETKVSLEENNCFTLVEKNTMRSYWLTASWNILIRRLMKRKTCLSKDIYGFANSHQTQRNSCTKIL